jgi:hypothetical protein
VVDKSSKMLGLGMKGAGCKQGMMAPASPGCPTAGIGRVMVQQKFMNTYKTRRCRSLKTCIRAELITANRGASVMQSGSWDEKVVP